MGRNSKYTIEQKIEAVLDYKTGKRGVHQICKDLDLHRSGVNLYRWVQIYEYGDIGLPKQRNQSYSKELKESAINDYLTGKGSYEDIARLYKIPSSTTLINWVSKYNGYEKLKDYKPKGEVYMTKGRKTTLEERQEIVAYCLAHDSEYKLAAKHYNVSYGQSISVGKKYQEQGEIGFQNKRGKHKQADEFK